MCVHAFLSVCVQNVCRYSQETEGCWIPMWVLGTAASIGYHLVIYTNVIWTHCRGSVYMGLYCVSVYKSLGTNPRYSQTFFSETQNLPEVIGPILVPCWSSQLLMVVCLGKEPPCRMLEGGSLVNREKQFLNISVLRLWWRNGSNMFEMWQMTS